MNRNTANTMRDEAQCSKGNLSRRGFLKALGGAGLAALAPRLKAAPTAQDKRPSIIVVLLDDLGYGQFGPNSDSFTLDQLNPLALERIKVKLAPEVALGAARAAVPNITRLANEGMRFADAYVTHSLCAPSRTGLMTSRYPQRLGFYNNIDVSRNGVPAETPFPVKALKESGYATAAIGKWHLAAVQERRGELNDFGMQPGTGQHPLDRGFDHFFGFNNHSSEYYDSKILWRNRERAKPEGYLTEQFTREALEFIRAAKDKPFFLYLAYNAVHGPLNKPAPEQYLKKFNTGNRGVDNYYATLNAADEGIGRIRKLLEEQGRAENTLILVLGDNGASGGSPLPGNGPFLGFKGQLWQGGLRVPMIAWGPGVVKAGQVCRQPVISLDVMPTALAFAGVKGPEGLDGRSLLPLLRGGAEPPHETLFWAGQLADKWAGKGQIADELTAPPAWAVRKGRWMLHTWTNPKRHELYDLERDKGERRDVAADHPEVVGDLKKEYAAWFKGLGKPVAWSEELWKSLEPEG